MEAEMKSACIRAAVRLGFGLSIVLALVGIRIVTATPDGVEAGIEELERLDAEIAAEAVVAPEEASVAETEAGGSIVSRFGEGVRDRITGTDDSSRDGDKLVSCRIGGRSHFMRAGDCAMRGGSSTIVEKKPER